MRGRKKGFKITDTTGYVIEKNVKIPEGTRRGGRMRLYPFGSMKPGDSFLLPKSKRASANSAASYFGKRNDMKFSILKMPDGTYRCFCRE